MKYFEVGEGRSAEQFFGVRSLRKYLQEHPEVASVWHYWWSGSDLVECEEVSREDVLTKSARELRSGMTAQWAGAHGRLHAPVSSAHAARSPEAAAGEQRGSTPASERGPEAI
jgi:hypothetical protein